MRRGAVCALLFALTAGWIACSPSGEATSSPAPSQPQPSGGATQVGETPGARQSAGTYYVRSDGGSPAQCTGLVDAPYTGASTDCAWDHPFRALPPEGVSRVIGGDTLVIGPGSYMMGYGAPEADSDGDNCGEDYPWGCIMLPVPSGPDSEHPTRILGAGWNTGCDDPPELWGTERADFILNLTGSSNVEIACLEITDHSGCVEDHSGGLACQRENPPFGEWAAAGIHAEDAANVQLRHLDIHGLAWAGVHAGRLTDWTVEDVRIAANGWVGWDGDLWDEGDSNTGTLLFRRWTVAWNGCAETYPGGEPYGCWAQTAGGYGDGVGTGDTGGDWIIEDSAFLYNTSDGLDLLYHVLGGSIVLRRVHAEGNAGNQIKVAGQASVENSVLVGNCTFFEGKPFTYNVDPCRAMGNTLEFAYTGGEQNSVINTSIYGHGDGLVGAGPREGGQCNGSETLTGRSNIFRGDADYFAPGDVTFLFYQEGCGDLSFEGDYSIAYSAKNIGPPWVNPPYPSAHNLFQNPQLTGSFSGGDYGMMLTSTSPAIDTGDDAFCPATDIRGFDRPADGDGDGIAACDMGAYEWPDVAASGWLPLLAKGY